MDYVKRIIDKEIKKKLAVMGAVVIKGPKWCGKTTSAKKISKSVIEMQNPEMAENYINSLTKCEGEVLNHWYRRFYHRGFKDGMNFESWGVDVNARERFETEEID